MHEIFRNKNILVTGGAGSIGKQIIKKLLSYNPHHIRSFDHNEKGQFELSQELQAHKNMRYLMGDVRDAERVIRAMEDVDYVFHTSALKHVPLCEYNPFEAVNTNVLGTQNVLSAAMKHEVKKVINISTDKAVNPAASMGATKLLAERLTSASYYYVGKHRTLCASVRFGNVMNTNGSVIPVFRDQIRRGEPVTITDNRMTRFMMSTSQAIDLVFQAMEITRGGEIFILKMPVLKIIDLAHELIALTQEMDSHVKKVTTQTIGARAGEKIHEELMTADEAQSALELPHMFIIPPDQLSRHPLKNAQDYPGTAPSQQSSYSSKDQKALSRQQIRDLLMETLYPNQKPIPA